MVIEFDGRPVTYSFGELDEVVLHTQRPFIRRRARSIQPSSSR
jgi:hypothetical protein